MSKWISVDDRLPENRVDVLMAGYAYNDPARGYWIQIGAWFYDKWVASAEDCAEWEGHPPTHWMPLPEAPSETL